MRFYLMFLLVLILPILAFAQPVDSLWSRTFGGSGADQCLSVQQTSDGGYILGGGTESFGAENFDFWLVKTNANGDSLWSRTFGTSHDEVCYSVQQTSDGGYILGGYIELFGVSGSDFWLVKTNANGDSLWSRNFGGSGNDRCNSVQQTSDGGYILGGLTRSNEINISDFWMVKTNANGDSVWSRTFGGSGADNCNSVQQTSDGGYILGGITGSYGAGYYDSWLVKTDENGDSLWSRTFGGSNWDECYSVQQTSDGGYILGGRTDSYGVGSYDFWLVKTNANGDSLWSRIFGGNSRDECWSVQQTTDGGYILGGWTWSYGVGCEDFLLVKTNANGDSLWSRTFGGSYNDRCMSIQQTTDGGYILAGDTWSFGAGGYDFWLVKTGSTIDVSITQIEPLCFPNIDAFVSVMKGNGIPVLGLTESNFRVYEGGTQQIPIAVTPGAGDAGISVGFVMDYSYSMSSGDIDAMESACHTSVNEMEPWDRGAVVKFANGVELEQNFTSDKDSIHTAIDISFTSGIFYTWLYDAICSMAMLIQPETQRRVMLVLTDGQNNGGTVQTADSAIACAKVANVTVYTIGLGDEVEEDSLRKIADETGGQYYFAPDSSGIQEIYQLISNQIANEYLVEYTTNNPVFDGTERELVICVDYDGTSDCDSSSYTAPDSITNYPITTEVVISPEGDDIRLRWLPTTESVVGCPITILGYDVYSSTTADGAFQWLATVVGDTTYLHVDAASQDSVRFYYVKSVN